MAKVPESDAMGNREIIQESTFFSYGFRPFFLGAAIFSSLAIPFWIYRLVEGNDVTSPFPARDWHIHEMLFGFLPAVMTGFLLTAIPNWTDRPPVRSIPLMSVFALWLAGRMTFLLPSVPLLLSSILDGAFLISVAGIVWWEIARGRAWDRFPIGILISLYALANIFYHVRFVSGEGTELPERLALGLVLILLSLIGGRITPSFTSDYLEGLGRPKQPLSFSTVDALSIVLVGFASIAWIAYPWVVFTGWMLIAAGVANLVRGLRWYGWLSWREPLVLILHVGYGWLALSLFMMGGAILGIGVKEIEAVHAITTGAVGVMTLAVMTRATLGHTGRPKHAGASTVLMYLLVNLGAILRVFGPAMGMAKMPMLALAAVCWSGAYMVFVRVYGPMLLQSSLDEQ